MFDEIRDFVVKNKIWFIICGIICALAGAVMAALISLYFLIAVAVGLIVSVVSGFMKNKEIKEYKQQTIVTKGNITPDLFPKNENQKIYDQKNNTLYNQNEAAPPISTPTLENNQELDEYKKEARKRITKEYVQLLLTDVEKRKKIDESEDMCSSLIQQNRFGSRGDYDAFKIIWTHFSTISIKSISKNFNTVIRGDIEVLFEVLTGVEWNKVEYTSKNSHCLKIASELSFDVKGHGSHDFSKCFFEHTILCACALYQNRKLTKYSNLDFIPFYFWDENHKHGSVLKQPETDTLPDQSLSK